MAANRLVLAILLLISFSKANEVDSLFVRWRSSYSKLSSIDSSYALVLAQNQDGSWNGPDYQTKGHTPIEHLRNVRTLAEGFYSSCATEFKQESSHCTHIKNGAVRALIFWFSRKKDFVSENWWMNEIGIQRELAPIAFLMWDDFSLTLQKAIISYFPEEPSGNGTNRTWISENVIARGILEKRPDLIRRGVQNIESTMAVTDQEGHQTDHSFFMHGNLLYNGGYGRMALSMASRMAFIVRGTSFAFSPETVNDMFSLALEGNRWMMWKGMVDPMTMGREISRREGNKGALGNLSIIENLVQVDSIHTDEYKAWREEIYGGNHLSGCRYFDRGELMVCRSPDYYISLKMSSKNTVGSESINRENRRGFWLGSGVLSLYRHPDDFKDIYPLWDWSMLPGTTSDSRFEQKEKRVTNESVKVGGVGDGKFGVAAMELNRSGLYAKKMWLFLDGKVVALGSDISSKEKSEIKTSLDQRLVRSDVVQNGPRVWHDSIGYASLLGPEILWKSGSVQGDWRNIGTEKNVASGDVLKMWLTHGKKPKGAKYAYAIFLNVSQQGFLDNRDLGVDVVQNDSQAQIAMDRTSGAYGGVVYTAMSIKKGNINVSFDKPCVFLVNSEGKVVKKSLKF